MKCPECTEEMVWQNDFDGDECIISCWSCDPCLIDVEKRFPINSD